MLSTSKSTRRKPKNFKFVPKPKQQWRVKEPKRNWLELPSDVMANILYRVGVFDILENAQKVCTTWRNICKDPAMWRVIYMENHSDPCTRPPLQQMCKHAVDRSQGQLVDLTLVHFANHELLLYIADRSSQLRRLDITYCFGEFYDGWTEILNKFPLLEKLSLCTTEISKEDIKGAGDCCPMLRTLKVNQKFFRFSDEDSDVESLRIRNQMAIAIGKNLPELRHLELIGNTMSNTGLLAILNGCPHLESLDLRQCLYLDLKGEFGKKCLDKIKCVKLPNDSLEGLPLCLRCDDSYDLLEDFVSGDSDYEYDECFDYDEYTNPYHYDYINNVKPDLFGSDDDSIDIDDLGDMMTFMVCLDDLFTERCS
ncbi:F-box protein SKIP19 isoform X1 [Lactuca sativa]|uniref:F-box protein SKIP19 isoform X1 n=1 Tax=Lactuca sativa TaxID=4236 RepID=UPI000CD85786|nr:F-box protein SKIP19 isoform X1 [Lactuca sativa]